MRLQDVAHHQEAVDFQQSVELREQSGGLFPSKVLRDRVQHDEIERVLPLTLDLVGRDRADLGVLREAHVDAGAYSRRPFT
jgi:hypothetical protein